MSSTVPTSAPTAPSAGSADRSVWRKVALPSEHGGWGLTLEPALLALLVAPSRAGFAIGFAAVFAFLVRTPTKLVLVDLARHRWLPRTARAAVVAAIEAALIVVLGTAAIVGAGWSWTLPVLAGLPLLLVELWYDARSRGRRLVPELCGAVGIGATAAAIVVAAGEPWELGVALWAILAGRGVVSILFIRAQIQRLRRGSPMARSAISLQGIGMATAIVAGAVEPAVLLGSAGVVAIAGAQAATVRRPVPPPKVLGMRQLAFGLTLTVVTAVGVHLFG